MALSLKTEELNFALDTVENSINLLDNVHCYETEEFENLKKLQHILNGFTLEEIENFSDD